LSLITTVGLITIAGSTYLIIYSNRIYANISGYLSIFERKGRKVDEHTYHKDKAYKIILFGYNRIGYDLLESLKKMKRKLLVVDFNPDTVLGLAKEGFNCKYGDAGDVELLNGLNLSKAKVVVSTIPDLDTNLLLVNKVKELNSRAITIVVSHKIEAAMRLYREGATYVVMPHFLGGRHASALLEKHGMDFDKFFKEKLAHMNHLKKRLELGYDHPAHHLNNRG
jgi:voltage-gated potassium channel Kch